MQADKKGERVQALSRERKDTMINAEKFKEILGREKAKLEAFITELNRLRDIAGRYDGKIYDKRIREAIQAEGFHVYKSKSGFHELVIYGDAYGSDWDLFCCREKDDFCEGKRFSQAKFRRILWITLQRARKNLAGIEKDLIDTERKLYELHQAAKYYAEQVKELSEYAQQTYRRTLELSLFDLNNYL